MKKVMLLGALFGAGAVFYSCGGGGGTTSQTDSSTVALYFTDDASMYPVVEVTVHEVNLCKDPKCSNKVNLFADGQGITINLSELSGVLQYIDSANIPQGEYSRLEIILSKNAVICDSSGQCHSAVFAEMDENPSKPNVVNCPQDLTDQEGNQLCYIRYNGTINPEAQNKLVVDFDLKEFDVDTSTTPWRITEVKVYPVTPEPTSTYEMYAIVESVDGNSINVSWAGSTYTVTPADNFVCEMGDIEYQGQSCMENLMQGMCVELKVIQDPSTTAELTVVELETEDMKDCGNGGKEMDGHEEEGKKKYRERKGIVEILENNQITVGDETFTITDDTICEINEVYYRGQDCINNLQNGMFVEVEVDANGNVLELEVEEYMDMDDDSRHEDEE